MKKRFILFGLVVAAGLVTFVKPKAKAVESASHYCEIIKSSPGNVQAWCTGTATACATASDCFSN